MGFDVTRPLFLGAGALALLVVVVTWWRMAPPLSPRRARVSLGLRVLIVNNDTAAVTELTRLFHFCDRFIAQVIQVIEHQRHETR